MSVVDNLSPDDFATQGELLFVNGVKADVIDAFMDAGFVDVRDKETGKMLFRYDPAAEIVEVQKRGQKMYVDLKSYQQSATSAIPQGGLHEHNR
jgi:hypothetical protein